MVYDIIKQHKIIARKNIAKYNKLLSKESNLTERLDILNKIANEECILNMNISSIGDSSLLNTIHKLRHNSSNNCQDCLTIKAQLGIVNDAPPQVQLPTLGHLREILEENANSEWNSFGRSPSSNDIKRWALKAAVSDYYNSLNYDVSNPVIDIPGSLRAINHLAPNKEWIFKSYVDKLNSMVQRNDAYRLDHREFDESYDRGIPRGGAFEKQLDRYREDFMYQLNNIKR